LTELSNWDLISSTEEVLSALPETVVAVDDDLRLRAVNRALPPLFVRTPVLGDRLGDVLQSSTMAQVTSLIVEAQREGRAEGECDTGSARFRVTARRMKAPHTFLIFQDATILRHAEAAVADVVRDRSRFLASVSHELRTPLSAVLGYANLLAEPDPNLDEPMRVAMVQDMTDQAWDLAGIVEDLLAVARTEIGELRVVTFPVNLAANVAQVIESMGGRGAHIEVIARQAVTGVGDPARFRQVVRNLLSNAATHGAEPITVEITANDTHGILEVKDLGLGVPDALTEAIFNQYVFAHNGSGSGRVGVGLWISRELTNLMSGNLSYRREGGATVFRATIPLLHEPERRR
jgi:two-component system sensor histidine kinase MtrB